MDYIIDREKVKRQLGPVAYDRLYKLQYWLYETNIQKHEFRVAPSLIARCEAELFGVSSPRFALRVCFTQNCIINIRRLAIFADKLFLDFSELHSDGQILDCPSKTSMNKLIVDPGQCLADSILDIPSRFSNPRRYHILKVELGLAYGEARLIEGTPFLQHIPTAGGMCGHAAVFMVSMLQAPQIRFIYGLSEIAAVAQGHDGEAFILSDVTPDSIIKFFNNTKKIKMKAYKHFIGTHPAIPDDFIHAALKGYLESDIPLILSVDLGRMWGDKLTNPANSIIKKNGVETLLKRVRPKKFQKEPHMVVLVGCHTSEDEYLLNDPATYPFLKASLDQIKEIRRYTDDSLKTQEPLTFFSVIHEDVSIPLLDVKIETFTYYGLIHCARDIQVFCYKQSHSLPLYDRTLYYPGHWRLVDFRDISSIRGKLLRFPGDVPEDVIDLIIGEINAGRLSRGWHWIQYLPMEDIERNTTASVWIWDAQRHPIKNTGDFSRNILTDQHLLDVLIRDKTGLWQSVFDSTSNTTTSDTKSNQTSKQLLPTEFKKYNPELCASLISSFCPCGASLSRRVLSPYDPKHPVYQGQFRDIPAEVYMMMETEIDGWIDHFVAANRPGWRSEDQGMGAVRFLGKLDDPESLEIVNQLHKLFSQFGSEIIAINSFIPEITHNNSVAVKAIRRLIWIAGKLQKKGHATHTIVLVAGSRNLQVKFPDEKDPMFEFNIGRKDIALKVLNKNLTVLADVLNQLDPEYYVNLSLDLEPGEHFLLNNWKSIQDFADILFDSSALSQHIGLTFNIAHWRLAKIPLNELQQSWKVQKLINHAHIAGHHQRAHFGDTRLFDFDTPNEFRPWLDLLHGIAKEGPSERTCSKFSGYVSVELEASRDDILPAESFKQAKDLGL